MSAKNPKTMSPFEPGYNQNLVQWLKEHEPKNPASLPPFSPEFESAKKAHDDWAQQLEAAQLTLSNAIPDNRKPGNEKHYTAPKKDAKKTDTKKKSSGIINEISGVFGAAIGVNPTKKTGAEKYDGVTPPAIFYNNPFALIQAKPDNWTGLVGVNKDTRDNIPDGFLMFATKEDGMRAGLINLYNVYFKPNNGVTTIAAIFPRYAPTGHGNNDPQQYIRSASKISGIPANKIINFANTKDIVSLSKAIYTVEAGKNWINDTDTATQYESVCKRFGIKPTGLDKKKTENLMLIGGGLILLALGIVVVLSSNNS